MAWVITLEPAPRVQWLHMVDFGSAVQTAAVLLILYGTFVNHIRARVRKQR